jgi:hypothetical protein
VLGEAPDIWRPSSDVIKIHRRLHGLRIDVAVSTRATGLIVLNASHPGQRVADAAERHSSRAVPVGGLIVRPHQLRNLACAERFFFPLGFSASSSNHDGRQFEGSERFGKLTPSAEGNEYLPAFAGIVVEVRWLMRVQALNPPAAPCHLSPSLVMPFE